ncbi:hypothetical protein GUITHDRAFT_102125 [Guillardia theta CCMP2712]|uniref:Uncharacterized protein n=1 Tax=Guillardia theta (strain CCMP2712) TaxID=905079 RepID=L1JVU3_GUITC|nr:hypothetical protein GUITHDRAFT_102125 [Guillardia theta CCMP2712]EKX52223.1 hypothetical protein GUITHDRAFT_102125 [Guillardia theta CCMP2712]|eukprot:XP_005839203.1 hypothetical protein GUITHDRAFT_102125 [Guillardia theta CCMP2712]
MLPCLAGQLVMGGNQSSDSQGANQVWSLTCNDFCRADRAERPSIASPSSPALHHPGTSSIDRTELQKRLLENLMASKAAEEGRPGGDGRGTQSLPQRPMSKVENLSAANERAESSFNSTEDYRGLWQVRTEWTVNVRDQPRYNARVVDKYTGGQVFQVDGQHFDDETGVQWLRLPNNAGFVARRHKDGSLLVTKFHS